MGMGIIEGHGWLLGQGEVVAGSLGKGRTVETAVGIWRKIFYTVLK